MTSRKALTHAVGHVRYETTIIAVGQQAEVFLAEGIVVLFGEQAPEELQEYAVIHRPTATGGGVMKGDVIMVNGEGRLRVLAVGAVANDNLAKLGHVTLRCNGDLRATLPGDLCCEEAPIPVLAAGDRLRIVSGDARLQL